MRKLGNKLYLKRWLSCLFPHICVTRSRCVSLSQPENIIILRLWEHRGVWNHTIYHSEKKRGHAYIGNVPAKSCLTSEHYTTVVGENQDIHMLQLNWFKTHTHPYVFLLDAILQAASRMSQVLEIQSRRKTINVVTEIPANDLANWVTRAPVNITLT